MRASAGLSAAWRAVVRSISSVRIVCSSSPSPRAVTKFACALTGRSGSESGSWSDSLTKARLMDLILILIDCRLRLLRARDALTYALLLRLGGAADERVRSGI